MDFTTIKEVSKEDEMIFYREQNDFLRKSHGNNTTVALVGYPNSGSSSLFNLLTHRSEVVDPELYSTLDMNIGHRKLFDERFNWLCDVFDPDVKAPQYVTILDCPALVGSAHIGHGLGSDILKEIETVTTIFLVLRGFDNDDISHIDEIIDPCSEMKALDQELKVHDFEIIEAQIVKEEKSRSQSLENRFTLECLYKAWGILMGEEYGDPTLRRKDRITTEARMKKSGQTTLFRACKGLSLRSARWQSREIDVLINLRLLTGKQVVYVPNLSARDYCRKYDKWTPLLKDTIETLGGGMLARISVEHEERLKKFSDKKLKDYLDSNSESHASSLDSLFDSMIISMDLARFYVCSAEQVAVYFCRSGTLAPTIAGLVHADYEINFNFLQVMTYDDLYELGGNVNEVKADGKFTPKGTKYVVNDGDIVDFSMCTKEFRESMAKKRKG